MRYTSYVPVLQLYEGNLIGSTPKTTPNCTLNCTLNCIPHMNISPIHRFFDQCQLWLWKANLLALTCRKETLSKKIGRGQIILLQRWCWKVSLCIFLKSSPFPEKLPMAKFDLRTSCMASFLTLVLTTWIFQLMRNFGFCWLLIQSQSPYKLKILKTYG